MMTLFQALHRLKNAVYRQRSLQSVGRSRSCTAHVRAAPALGEQTWRYSNYHKKRQNHYRQGIMAAIVKGADIPYHRGGVNAYHS